MIGSADIPIAMPAQGLGRCDIEYGDSGTEELWIAMPAQGLGRCDSC